MTPRQKFIKAIGLAKSISDLDYIRDRLAITDEINRRTIEGRKLSEELFWAINTKAQEFIDSGEKPF